MDVAAGFSGWWCERCDAPAHGIPDDLDAAQARCPRCRKWTAVWVPPGAERGNFKVIVDMPEPDEPVHHEPRFVGRQWGKELFGKIYEEIEAAAKHAGRTKKLTHE